MKRLLLLAAMAMLFSGGAACRNPDLQSAAGTREFSPPPEGSPPPAQPPGQPTEEKSRGSARATGNGDGMQNSAGRGIIVKFKAGLAGQTVASIARAQGLEVVKIVSAPDLYLLRVRKNLSLQEAIRRLKALSEVEYAEPDYTRETQ